MLQGDLDVLVNRAEFIIFMQSRVPLGPGKFHVVVLVIIIIALRLWRCKIMKGSEITYFFAKGNNKNFIISFLFRVFNYLMLLLSLIQYVISLEAEDCDKNHKLCRAWNLNLPYCHPSWPNLVLQDMNLSSAKSTLFVHFYFTRLFCKWKFAPMVRAEIFNEGSKDYWEGVLWRIFLSVNYACISCQNLFFCSIFFF